MGEINDHKVELLVDSGASNNFLSRADACKYGLTIEQGQKSTVRLADGKKLICTSYVEALVSFGRIQCVQRFEVLDADVLPILGYTFLHKMNPTIDWERRLVFLKHRGRKYELKTLSPHTSSAHVVTA